MFVVIRKQRDLVDSKMYWFYMGGPRLYFAVNRISPLPNYFKHFRAYFAWRTILQEALFYIRHGTSRCFCCCMICL